MRPSTACAANGVRVGRAAAGLAQQAPHEATNASAGEVDPRPGPSATALPFHSTAAWWAVASSAVCASMPLHPASHLARVGLLGPSGARGSCRGRTVPSSRMAVTSTSLRREVR